MRATGKSMRLGGGLARLGLCVVAAHAIAGPARAGSEPARPSKPDAVAIGSEIFNREWLPDDPRGHGGDGLGPAFNDTSCVACHNAGGGGGGGPVGKNIDILSAARNNASFMAVTPPAPQPEEPADPAAGLVAAAPARAGAACPPQSASQIEPLIALHAGFKAGRTVVLHKFGTDPGYDAFRARFLGRDSSATRAVIGVDFAMPTQPGGGSIQSIDLLTVNRFNPRQANRDARPDAGQVRLELVKAAVAANHPGAGGPINVGPFLVSRSQRNPTSLFGLGLVDAIPESAIEAMARKQAGETPGLAGRVARVKDGRVGRLGWKGQTANTEDFVLNACAVEIGLEVPGHHQAMSPMAPRHKASGLDLTGEECASLVTYVRSLPRPVERASTGAEAKYLAAGKAAFASIGCASCHTSRLGQVEGLYSDLLIHEMGDELADSGSYNGSDDGSDEPLVPLADNNGLKPTNASPSEPKSARKKEWRTPPLWGFRDSAPYLHDGRAQTLEQAVALHGGQGAASAQRYFALSPKEKAQVEAFLKSLVAPNVGGREAH